MIVTRTPFRVSFVGGGSDMKEFYERSIGMVLSTTINKFMYVSSNHFFDKEKIRVKYSQTETVDNVGDLKHPIVREVLKKFEINGAIEISSNADIPSGTGLGSSSSYTVGLLHNLYTVNGRFVTKKLLAEEACDIEINKLQEPIGKQDQYAAAFGGLNIIKFDSSGSVDVEPIYIKEKTSKVLQNNLLMFYTGEQRMSNSILAEQKLNVVNQNKFELLKRMAGFVLELRDALYSENLNEFGMILHKNWVLKKQLASKISSPIMDELYEKALKNGALGGKLLGAGGGGFLLFYCDEGHQQKLRDAMFPLRELKFRFENEGTKVIFASDEYGNY